MYIMDFKKVLPLIEKRFDDMKSKEAVEFRTYKKDRGILIYFGYNGEYKLVETGFENDVYTGDGSKIIKQIKISLAREFPTNRKAWVEHYHNLECPLDIKRCNINKNPSFLP